MSAKSRGLCECGCGEETNLAPRTSKHHGWVRGEPLRFKKGHSANPKKTYSERRATANAAYLRWAKENPDELRAQQKRFRDKNAKKIRERINGWKKRNPHKIKAQNARRRAMRTSSECDYSSAELLQMYEDQGRLCAYCEIPLDGQYHVEHMVPLSRGGLNRIENIAIVCVPCNLSKGVNTVEEFVS